MKKEIIYAEDARNKMLAGVEKLSNAVRLTLGAKGRNVIIKQRYGSPLITNDGVTIAKEVNLEDEFENMGADIVKEVASRTNDMAGDGTSTSVILCHAIFKEGLRYIKSGANAMSIKDGISKATKLVVEELKKQAVKIETKEQKQQVATISSQDEEIGKIIADMLEEIGDDGIITFDDNTKPYLETEIVKGMQLEAGWFSHYFINKLDVGRAEYKDVSVLVTDNKLSNTHELMGLFNEFIQSGKKDLVIFSADGVEGQMLADLINNKMAGKLNSLVVKCPGFGDRKKDLLQDIAIATGAKYITRDAGLLLKDVKMEHLGSAGKITAERDKTLIVEGRGNKAELQMRIDSIKNEIKRNKSEFEKEKLNERLAKLTGGVGVIKVGAATESEQQHRLHRTEDAVEATKAAIEEGIVDGGGVALIKVLGVLDKMPKDEDERAGFEIVKKSLLFPARQIAENAGRDGGEIIAEIKRTGLGYNAKTNSFTNMIDTGIIDPVKVTRYALENASSAASILLTTECAMVYDDKDDNK